MANQVVRVHIDTILSKDSAQAKRTDYKDICRHKFYAPFKYLEQNLGDQVKQSEFKYWIQTKSSCCTLQELDRTADLLKVVCLLEEATYTEKVKSEAMYTQKVKNSEELPDMESENSDELDHTHAPVDENHNLNKGHEILTDDHVDLES